MYSAITSIVYSVEMLLILCYIYIYIYKGDIEDTYISIERDGEPSVTYTHRHTIVYV